MKTIVAIALCFTFSGCATLQPQVLHLPIEIGPEKSKLYTPEITGVSFRRAPFRIVAREAHS